MTPYHLIYLPDIHTPAEDRKTFTAVENYLKDSQPVEIVIGGDFTNLDCISSHNITNLRAVEGTRIQRDMDYANRFLDRLQGACPGTKKWVYIEGNHEYRLNRYVDIHPQMAGILEIPTLLNLAGRGFKWVPQWSAGEVHKVGKANFIHGEIEGDLHAKKMVTAYEDNVFYGHTHDIQAYSKVSKGTEKTHIAQSFGCLCEYGQPYMRGKADKWQQAFGDFYFTPDGFFTYFVVPIFKHRFTAPNGAIYDGNKLSKGVKWIKH